MTVGKTRLKSVRRKQPRIIAQFPVDRFLRVSVCGNRSRAVECAVSGRIMWINSLGHECGVKVENATNRETIHLGYFKRCANLALLQIVARLTAGKSSDGCR